MTYQLILGNTGKNLNAFEIINELFVDEKNRINVVILIKSLNDSYYYMP